MNPYEVLNVPSNASFDQISAVFRTMAESAHPDRHAGDPNALPVFYSIVEAYNVLCDPISRFDLDQKLMAGKRFDTFRSEDFKHSDGFVKYSADELLTVINNINSAAASAKSDAGKFALSGILWFVGGLAVTIISAIIGVGVLAYGAIIFGAVEAFRGLKAYLGVNGKLKKVKDQFWADYLKSSTSY